MATKSLFEYLIIASAVFTLVSASEFQRYFITREQNLSDFQVYSHNVAESIKNLPITTPKSKLELGIMGYEFVNKIHDSMFYLNKAVLNVKDYGFHDKLDKVINKLSVMVNEFQHILHVSELSKIKEKLVFSIDVILEVCDDILEIVKEYQAKISPVIYGPFQVGVHRALFAIHQLKYQANLFEKTNEELTAEVKNALTVFIKALTRITSESDELQKELIYQIVQLEHIIDKTVLKLETWVQLNSNETEKVKTVKEISLEVSTMYEKLHRLASNHHTVSYIASHFSRVYRDFNTLVKKLGHLDLEQNYGTQEYIRPILLNSVSISYLYTTELGYLSKYETPKHLL